MKQILLFALLAVTAGSWAQMPQPAAGTDAIQKKTPAGAGFVINGKITGLLNGPVKLTTIRGEQTVASTDMKEGAFVLQGSVPEPGLYWLTIGNLPARYIFIEPVSYRVSGIAGQKSLKIEGGAGQQEFAQFETTFNPLFANLNAIANEINATGSEAKKASLLPKYNAAIAGLHTEVDKFIAPRLSSPVALFVLSVTMQSMENVTDVERRFNKFGEALKASVMGKEIAGYIAYAKVGAVGTPALDFIQNDVNDKPVSLSSFKGKYVLVDFWASWCRPCRIENPNVVKAYNKFKDKNFTVLGVSLDQQKEAWLTAIAKDKLTWTHVSDLQYWNNAAAQLYRVQSIPQNFLIDPNGTIVAKDLRGEDLEKKLCEYLGCTN